MKPVYTGFILKAFFPCVCGPSQVFRHFYNLAGRSALLGVILADLIVLKCNVLHCTMIMLYLALGTGQPRYK